MTSVSLTIISEVSKLCSKSSYNRTRLSLLPSVLATEFHSRKTEGTSEMTLLLFRVNRHHSSTLHVLQKSQFEKVVDEVYKCVMVRPTLSHIPSHNLHVLLAAYSRHCVEQSIFKKILPQIPDRYGNSNFVTGARIVYNILGTRHPRKNSNTEHPILC